jgi:predicted HD phosphohydrolase
MFEIADNRSVKVKIYGQEYTLKKMLYSELEKNVGTDLDLLSGKEKMAQTSLVLEQAGVPKELIASMTADDIGTLVEFLIAGKKN